MRGNVINLVSSASEFGQMNVHNRHYTIPGGLIEKAAEIVRDSLIPTFFDGIHHTDMKDITDAFRIHRSALSAFQIVARHTDLSHAKMIAEKLESLNGRLMLEEIAYKPRKIII